LTLFMGVVNDITSPAIQLSIAFVIVHRDSFSLRFFDSNVVLFCIIIWILESVKSHCQACFEMKCFKVAVAPAFPELQHYKDLFSRGNAVQGVCRYTEKLWAFVLLSFLWVWAKIYIPEKEDEAFLQRAPRVQVL